jgi:hypothetical protein
MSWEKYKLHTQEPQRYYKKRSSKVLLRGDKNYKGKIEIVSYDKKAGRKLTKRYKLHFEANFAANIFFYKYTINHQNLIVCPVSVNKET